MKKYNTRQRQMLLDFLKEHADESFSGLEIVEKTEGSGISKSAVYRNLSELEKEGKIRRVSKDGEHTAHFRYIDEEHCKGHIHLSCIKCGKTGHISDDAAKKIAESLIEEDGFSLDSDETVIYGICDKCKS